MSDVSDAELNSDELVIIYSEEVVISEIPVDETISVGINEATDTANLVSSLGDNLIINYGEAGVDFHGYGSRNDRITLPSGATAWKFADANDAIAVPPGDAVDNLSALTFEFTFFINGSGGNNAGRLWSKQQRGLSGKRFDIYVDDIENRVVIQRNTIYDVDEWKTPLGSVIRDDWNYLQISWESLDQPTNEPLVIINNTTQEMTHTLEGTGLWIDDSGHPAYFGNATPFGGYNLNATVALIRMYRSALSRGVLKSNYLADLWKTHDPTTGALAVPSDATKSDTDPILRIGKNLSSIDVQFDYSPVVTQLYPRGGGQAPSELRLDNPAYYPPVAKLELLQPADNQFAYFKLPGDYTCYDGFTGVGDPLPSGMVVGRGVVKQFRYLPPVAGPPYSKSYVLSSLKGTQAYCGVAEIFTFNVPFRLYEVLWYLRRVDKISTLMTAKEMSTGSRPRLICGLYTTTLLESRSSAPYQGPLVWGIIDLHSIVKANEIGNKSPAAQWYSFPMQSAVHPAGTYAVVLTPYPPSTNLTEIVEVVSSAHTATSYATAASSGITPTCWWPSALFPTTTINAAMQFNTVGPDVSKEFQQSWAAMPGRVVKTPASKYVPNSDYWIHYKHAPYMVAWDSYQEFGKIEGTYKDDKVTTHGALLNAASQYLKTISQPVITLSLSAADLYDLDPYKNWTEELTLGGQVTVSDDTLRRYDPDTQEMVPMEMTCIISKITKPNLNMPHEIQIQLDNIHPNAPKLLAKLASANLTMPKYLQGQTVENPYTTTALSAAGQEATLYFEIRDVTTLTQGVKLSVKNPTSFTVTIDGNLMKG